VLLAQEVGNCVSQHYTRDIGFVIDGVFFVARPRRPYRQRELEGIRSLLPLLETVAEVGKGCIEGGDVLLHRDRIIVGYGEETDADGVNALRRALEQHGIEREVCELRFQRRGIIHLDTKLNIVAPELALIDRTVFEGKSLAWIERNFELVGATPEESQRMEINTLVIGDERVVMRECSHRLANELAKRGLSPVLLDYSEVTALPGSFRCTTLPLERAEPGEVR
jgi:N-dimethylarginine dimethylaminohydrolase